MTCSICGVEKDSSEFLHTRKRLHCRRCRKNWEMIRLYDITIDEYEEMVEAQSGLCAICGGLPRGRSNVLVVDHCHTTGVIRGLLCHPCNHGIAIIGDTEERLQAAVNYLKRPGRV